jgi:glycosyltransferase involved in cell wall biosynthesis
MLFASQVLITESTYLLEAALVKRIKGKKFLLIQFSQELHLPEEYSGLKMAKIYEIFAQVPDIVVDVEPNRARVRKERFGLKTLPVVLPNTIPFKALPGKAPSGTLAALAGLTSFHDLPVLLHMGGLGREKPLERVIDAVFFADAPVFFLAFCNGPNEQIQALQAYAASKLLADRFRILQGMPRDTLLASAWEADIGVIDYTYSVQPSTNQKYCAPTKLYEFMAIGLAVLGSNNDSLKEVVEKENIGICAGGDHVEDLGVALRQLLNDREDLHSMKDRARKTFAERYSYERLCTSAINEGIIKKLK